MTNDRFLRLDSQFTRKRPILGTFESASGKLRHRVFVAAFVADLCLKIANPTKSATEVALRLLLNPI